MSCNCKEAALSLDTAPLEPYIAQCADGGEGGLIPLLQKAQELYGWLPPGLLRYISGRTGIKPAKVIGVVTFYTQFRTKPVGKHLILLCQGTACHVNGSAAIEDAVRETLGAEEGEITQDGLFTYSNVACLGCCSLSPVMMIGDKAYGGLTGDKAAGILKEIKKKEAGG